MINGIIKCFGKWFDSSLKDDKTKADPNNRDRRDSAWTIPKTCLTTVGEKQTQFYGHHPPKI